MGRSVLEGPSPWPAPAKEDVTMKSGDAPLVMPATAGGAVATGPAVAQAVASNVGTSSAPKVEVKEPARAGVAGGIAAAEVKPPEVPAAKTGGGSSGAGAADELAKVKGSPIEQTPIGGHAPETVSQGSKTGEGKWGTGGSDGTGGFGWSGVGGLVQTAAALAIVLGLIFVGKGLARKFVPGAKASNGKGVIEILARHPLAKNQAIVLVRIGSQIVALNQGRESSESVLVINDGAEVARIIGQIEGKSPHSISAGFNKLLANARLDLESGEEADLKTMSEENLDEQLDEMAAAKRQLMELRQHVRSVRDSLPRT
jgi:flagellar biogenesis protein FliO